MGGGIGSGQGDYICGCEESGRIGFSSSVGSLNPANYLGYDECEWPVISFSEGSLRDHLLAKSSGWERLKARLGICVNLGKYRERDEGRSQLKKYYLFECMSCRRLSVDYIHGERRLICQHCN